MGRLSSTWRGFIDHSSTWGDYHLHGGDLSTTPLHGGDYSLHGGDLLTTPLYGETIIYMEEIIVYMEGIC